MGGCASNGAAAGRAHDGATALDTALLWGLPMAPVLLMMLNAMAKTPFLALDGSSGAYCVACTVGSLAGFAAAVLVAGRGAGLICMRSLAVAATVVFEAAWIVMYALRFFESFTVLCICTAVVCLCCAVLLAVWMRIGRSATPRDTAFKYAAALMGAFVLYTLFSVLPDPIVASYVYAPAACALLLWRLSAELGSEASAARGGAGATTHTWREMVDALGLTWRVVAATAGLFALLGMGLAVVAEPNPPLGAFYGLGIASLALAATLFGCVNDASRSMATVAGPLAIAGLCSISIFGAGTAFAVFLAGCGVYVVWVVASIEASRLSDDAEAWHCEVAALALMALCVLFGFSLMRMVAGARLASEVVLGVASVGLVTVDTLWRAAVVPWRSEDVGEGAATTSSLVDALWLAETYGLSPRETEVAALLCENRSVGYICTRLDLATSTVKTHASRVYEKTGVHGKDELQLLVAERQG